MATEEKIKQFIAELAGRKNNVSISDIEWVMGQLESFGHVVRKQNDHQVLYTFNGRSFGLATHRSGGKQLKTVYVKEFLEAMSETGWFG